VPKISVPGRPAGGVDALGSLPGYDVRLTRKAAEAALDSCGHAHILAGGIWAPADAALFAIRQREGAQQVPALAAASLLAKKLAAGAGHVALDVRVAPHGNFGANVHDARAAARMFVRAAEIAGINAVCLLSDASGVQQPWLGRGEALAAVRRVLDGEAEGSLAWHADDCASIAAAIAGTPSALDAARDAFHRNLTAQGTSPEVWRARAQSVEGATRMPIAAPGEGYLRIDISRVRDALVDAQRRSPRPLYSLFPDPAGLVLAAMPGEAVVSGQPVAHLRAAGDDATALARTVAEAFSVSDFPPAPRASWHGESVE
jgi:pyrimidine-nucleoside phosphorylase